MNWFMKGIAVAMLLGSLMPARPAEANPFRPGFCGQCTDGAWILWHDYLGQETVSVRSAKYWYDDAAAKGFPRGDMARAYSLMVFDGWDTNHPNGHVGVAWTVSERWSGDFDLVGMFHVNWSPSTAGNCNAPFQFNYVAYHRPSRSAFVWNGSAWSRNLPVKGFVYRK